AVIQTAGASNYRTLFWGSIILLLLLSPLFHPVTRVRPGYKRILPRKKTTSAQTDGPRHPFLAVTFEGSAQSCPCVWERRPRIGIPGRRGIARFPSFGLRGLL